jgi:hypothetical protein
MHLREKVMSDLLKRISTESIKRLSRSFLDYGDYSISGGELSWRDATLAS